MSSDLTALVVDRVSLMPQTLRTVLRLRFWKALPAWKSNGPWTLASISGSFFRECKHLFMMILARFVEQIHGSMVTWSFSLCQLTQKGSHLNPRDPPTSEEKPLRLRGDHECRWTMMALSFVIGGRTMVGDHFKVRSWHTWWFLKVGYPQIVKDKSFLVINHP